MTDSPIKMAQSQERKIAVSDECEEALVKAFNEEWKKIEADSIIFNTLRLSRIYGISTCALLVNGKESNVPIDYSDLWRSEINFNVFDPLNTSGSLVGNLQPNDKEFLKFKNGVTVQGQVYHPSRVCIVLNEDPIYIGYTNSSFGYVGRSVYQRSLFPLKSFINSIITDDMVTRKAGVLIAKLKQPGSIIDNVMQTLAGIKRNILQQAQNNNVVSISTEEEVESLNLQNVSPAFGDARRNILENIAVSADMPAKILNSETFAEGFGEGTEDAKNVAKYIQTVRDEAKPLYAFFDKIVMYRAWNEKFFDALKVQYSEEYKGISYTEAFYKWVEGFKTEWPNLLIEPDSEKIRIEDARLKAVLALVEVLFPSLDPENKSKLLQWAIDNFNKNEMLFNSHLELDIDKLKDFFDEALKMQNDAQQAETEATKMPKPKRPFNDSNGNARKAYDESILALLKPKEVKHANKR
jgi:hypothetical protein